MASISSLVRNRSAWLRPYPAITLIVLVLAGAILVTYYRARSLTALRQKWVLAQHEKDLPAVEALYCWDGVDAAARQRMKLLILQEFETPFRRTLWVDLPSAQPMPGWRPNCAPVAGLYVEYSTDERLTAIFQVGRRGLTGHQFVIMVPER